MASKRRLRRRRCQGKKPYPNSATARRAIWQQRDKWRQPMSAYHCPFCGHHHIGRTPSRA